MQRGAHVRGLVRERTELPGMEVVIGDLKDARSLRWAAKGAHIIVHCAVSYGIDFNQASAITVEGTRNLAEAALSNRCERFVHISSLSVYDLTDVDLVTEDTPLWAFDEHSDLVYGVTKAEADRVVAALAQKGLPAVILRPGAILGGHPRSVWSHQIGERIAEGKGSYGGDGQESIPYVHISNLVDAIMAAIELSDPAGRAYSIVDGHVTWMQFAAKLSSWIGIDLKQREPQEPYETFFGRFLAEKARIELGYYPRVSYEEAMEQTRRYLQRAGIIAQAD
jgi:nucleoside-diphosphate-sugar epimerase